MYLSRTVPAALAGALTAVLTGCFSSSSGAAADETAVATASPSARAVKVVEPAPAPAPPEPTPEKTSTRTQTSSMSIPSIGLEDLRVVPYEGTTDDWPGTRIQNEGVAASPYGDGGGVGPGEVGNHLVTAHRISFGGPLRDLPAVEKGDSVLITSGGKVYEYKITETRKTSFRSPRSLIEQRAAVPGRPGERATRAMITISTCATPEDTAAGNHWRDDRGNPEHRIDKVGVLAATRDAPSTSP
ncbi:sortase [Streptomyces sp. NPDC029004]|uniref:sortase domain-containing protein n=1 Tax=Streptomyces sp. NPDC029004 TaxID=3154490 RepID=UPI0033E56385